MLTVDVRIDVDNHVESAMQKKNNRWVDSSKKKKANSGWKKSQLK